MATQVDMWLADTNGYVYTLNLEDNQLTCRCEDSFIIKRISAVESCAFAVGGDQNVYLFMCARDVAIRVQVTTYENQRWNPVHHWSHKSMFPTDRLPWSSQNGKEHTPKDSFELPDNWAWEDDWYIDEKVDGDEQGWQYALDFPREFHQKKSFTSCVRRRRWARYRRYVAMEKWVQIPTPITDVFVEKAIQDVSAGGTGIPGQENGYIALWAVNFAGQVIYRAGISLTCPEGTIWQLVDLPEDVKASQISVGTTGMVWVITWDVKLYLRTGVSKFQPKGLSWVEVQAPQGVKVYQLAVGVNAVWLLTTEGKVFFRRGISSSIGYTNREDAQGTKWVEMIGNFTLLSMALNDQIFALGSNSEHVYFRSDITTSELSGHEWKVIKIGSRLTDSKTSLSSESSQAENECERKGEDGNGRMIYSDQLTSSTEQNTRHFWNWISCGSCNIMADYFTSSAKRRKYLASTSTLHLKQQSIFDEPWRASLLEMLGQRDQKETMSFDFEQAVDQVEWFKSASFRMLQDTVYNIWCDCTVKLESQGESAAIIINHKKSSKTKEMKIMMSDITCLCRVHDKTMNNCFTIHTAVRTLERNSLVLSALSEKELNEWLIAMTACCQEVRKCEGPPKSKAMWCTSRWGDVFFSDSKDEEDFSNLPAYQIYWRQVGGHMSKVEAGINGIVWALSFDGKPWCFSRGFGGGIFSSQLSSAQGIYEQQDEDVFYTYENQRWNPVHGYGARRLLSDRWEWSDETGVLERRKDGYPLPNTEWQWFGEWKVDFNTHEGTDKEGWMYALDFPRVYSGEKKWNDCVRRRRWRRSAKITTTGPWVQILPAIPLKDISIQIDDRGEEHIAIWAVNHRGDVLFREGVTASTPQGKKWQHIATNEKFVSISVGCGKNIWGIGEDGAAYMRTGYGDGDELGKNWNRIPGVNHPLSTISVGQNTVWTVDIYGEQYFRESVTDTFPEGTGWAKIFGRVEDVSVGPNDEVWVKCKSGLEKCFITSPKEPTGRGWVLALPGQWRSISARAIANTTGETKQPSKTSQHNKDVTLNSIEPVKESSYQDLLESGDIYSLFGDGDFKIPDSDSED